MCAPTSVPGSVVQGASPLLLESTLSLLGTQPSFARGTGRLGGEAPLRALERLADQAGQPLARVLAIALATLLTFRPPGSGERMKRSDSSAGIQSVGVIWSMGYCGRVARLAPIDRVSEADQVYRHSTGSAS